MDSEDGFVLMVIERKRETKTQQFKRLEKMVK